MFEDLRYALRALAKHRALAAVAVLSLALGIGANTTIFTLINAVLLRPLPVEDPARLVAVHTLDSRNPGFTLCSYPNYKDYRDRNQVFSSLLLHSGIFVNLNGHGDPQLLMGQLVSGNYFTTLGVKPILGRGFTPEEDLTPGASPVAVLSHGVWMRQFGGDPRITSRTMLINGLSFQIVGVAPPGFQGLTELYAADVWLPMMMYPRIYPDVSLVNNRRYLAFGVVGRLKPGVGFPQAEAAMQALAQELEHEYPRENGGRRVRLSPISEAVLAPATRTFLTSAGTVFMVISALVLMIACANVANLLLARALARTKETTIRLALGASRWRLVRQLLVESLLLSVLGGAAGLLVARWGRDAIWSIRPPTFTYAGVRLELDPPVLFYSIGISLLTGILFGLVPAFQSTRSDLATNLKERVNQAAVSRRLWSPRSVLVSSEVAFSVIALVGAGLFVRSIRNVAHINPGFDAWQLGVITFNVKDQGYSEAVGRDYFARALETAERTPGVISAALSKDRAFRVSTARTVLLEGQENTVSGTGKITLTSFVGPGYFRTAGIPLLRGRDFQALDTPATPRVVIVNEFAAESFWPGQEPIGKTLHFFGDAKPAQVVAVARNANYQSIGEDPKPLIYLSLLQYYFPSAWVWVRTTGDPALVSTAVKQSMQPLDRNLLLQSESVGETIRESLWAQRLSATLLAVFGGLALLLATIGIYGVVAYSVHQRVREIGVRMALGATAADVQVMIVGQGIRVVAIGVAAGIVTALMAARLVQSMLFKISARDATTFFLVPSVLTLVAILACWIPAVRATRIDPSKALRDE